MDRVLAFSYPVTFPDNQFSIVGSSDATKTIKFEVDAQSAGADLTLNTGAQTADRSLTVPVLTADATLMVLSETQTVTGVKTFNAGAVATTVRITGTATGSNWSGRVVVGGPTSVFLMGQYDDQAWLGAHNAALNAWADFYINPDTNGATSVYIGEFPNAAPILRINNADGIVTVGAGGSLVLAKTTGTTLTVSSTTNSTSKDTGAIVSEGGFATEKNIIGAMGRGTGVTSTATAAGTTTLTATSTEVQTFTGTTTQTVQFPAANLFGAGIAVLFTINNQSTGTVTPTRAGADTFQGGGTTDPVLAGASMRYASNGVSVWLKT